MNTDRSVITTLRMRSGLGIETIFPIIKDYQAYVAENFPIRSQYDVTRYMRIWAGEIAADKIMLNGSRSETKKSALEKKVEESKLKIEEGHDPFKFYQNGRVLY